MNRLLRAARRIASPWLSYRERRRKERRQWETLLWMMRELDEITANGLLAPPSNSDFKAAFPGWPMTWPYNVKVIGTDGETVYEDDYKERDAAEFAARMRSDYADADRVELVADGVLTVYRDGEEAVL